MIYDKIKKIASEKGISIYRIEKDPMAYKFILEINAEESNEHLERRI